MRDYSMEVHMHFPSAGSARIVRNAILPEMHGKHEKRSTANMNINKNVLSLMVNAQDLTAMKASVNSYLKLVLLVTNLQNLE